MSTTTAKDYLAAARLLTEWTGGVSEAQMKTLNLWPAVMILGLRSHQVAIDLDQRKVTFKLLFRPKKSLRDFSVLAKLESGVWQLLGDTWLTIVKADHRIIFVGSRRKEFHGGSAKAAAPSPRPGGEGSQPPGTGSVP